MDSSNKSGKMTAGLSFAICFVLFAIFILNANKLYFLLSGKSYIEKSPDENSLLAGDTLQMRSVLDHPPINNQFEEGKGFRGEFVGIGNKKGDTRLRVFFRSPDALYELMENHRSSREGSEKTVVNFFASTVGLKRGIYQLGLYLPDDQGKRFAWIDSFFEKEKGGPVEYIARPTAPVRAKISKDLQFDIENFDRKYKKITCEGWAVLKNADMSGFNAYLLVKDAAGTARIFYAPLYARMDLISRYNDLRAANGGFRIKFFQQEFPPGDYTLSVVLESRKTGEAVESAQNEYIKLLPMTRGISARIRRNGLPPN